MSGWSGIVGANNAQIHVLCMSWALSTGESLQHEGALHGVTQPWFVLRSLAVGTKAFEGISGNMALRSMRALLLKMGVKEASKYRTHDLRRGHAEDMRASGASTDDIKAAGDWRSACVFAAMPWCGSLGSGEQVHFLSGLS